MGSGSWYQWLSLPPRHTGNGLPAEAADSPPVARALAPERRVGLRELGDTLSEITTTAVHHQPIDAPAIEHLTAADITADPFGVAWEADGISRPT